MFKRLNLKIRLYIIITLGICCISIFFISVRGICSVLETHFSEMAGRILTQKSQNLILFQKRVEALASQISTDEQILALLSAQQVPRSYDEYSTERRDQTDFISDAALVIDGKILLYKAIEGAAVFSTKGIAVTSGGLSPYPLSLLQDDPGIQSFFDSGSESYWSVRSENIPDYYRNNRYIKQKGIVSYILKIKDERDVLLGFIVIDVNPEYFYKSFSPSDQKSLTAGISVTLIGPDLQTVPMENGRLYAGSGILKEGLVSATGDSLKYICQLYDSGIKLGLDLPKQALKNDKFNVVIFSSAILAVALAFSITIAVIVSRSIIRPISKLQYAMRNPSEYLRQ